MARAAKREHELAISTAWHTAVFALSGYGGKLKDLAAYLGSVNGQDGKADEQRVSNARLIHFFHTLKARGVPVDISRAN
jgi:hypothetical protein